MIELDDKRCTACGACVQKCPKGCIELKSNCNGFLYPVINVENCVDCGLCSDVCPIEVGCSNKRYMRPIAYACVSARDSVLLQSTSGGIFGELATYVLGLGGVVYGCAYTEHLKVRHVRVESVNSLKALLGSKYVQSDTCDTYKECESDLKKGKEVLYSGTPCQIAGLKRFLQKSYPNLITVDLVCHGVASQDYFDKFITYLEFAEDATCINYDFRSKENAGWSVAGVASFEKKDKKEYRKKQYYFSNYYYCYYLAGAIYRDSCYSCKYTNLNRQGDFTLGDFWGCEKIHLPFSVEKGCSLVLLNSEVAKKVFSEIEVQKHEVLLEDAIKYNKQLLCPSCSRYDREELLKEFREDSADLIHRKFKKRCRRVIFVGKIKYLIPKSLKKILLKIRYQFLK